MKSEHTPERTARRSVDGIYGPPPLHWVGDGFRVAGYFSAIPDAVRRLDPFLMLDYHPTHEYGPTDRPRGVGVHPHRGFETVTLAFQGRVAHHDSTGAGGVIGPGDVQWMTAAGGILHKEYHEEAWARRGGPFQMAQLWVNLPRAHKLDAPGYQGITADRIGRVALPGGEVRVVAGEFAGVRGPARTHTPMQVLGVSLSDGGRLTLPIPAEHNLGLLVMAGELRLGEAKTARQDDFVVFANDGDRVELEAVGATELLVLAGAPIGEPVVQYGPFVMNRPHEIAEAIADLRLGKFGHLDD